MSHYPPASTQSLPYTIPQRQPDGFASIGQPPMMAPPSPQGGGAGYAKRFVNPKNVFICIGILLLTMLCVVPVWNAVALMQDFNYVFWVGTSTPTWMVSLCAGIVALYVITIFIFFSTARPQVQTEQTIMMIANIFITLLGLVLMLLSLPLSRQSMDTYNNLMHRCDYSSQTHRMYEYSQVLHNIRRTPLCMSKYSVEECPGYEEAAPYTSFLKNMESQLRCSGFCYRPPDAAQGASASLVGKGRVVGSARQHKDHVTPLLLETVSKRTAEAPHGEVQRYPPTLFSDANYQASCEGMAARDMKNFAGDVGFQTFYQGIYLVLIAIATGFLKLIGFCVKRDGMDMKPPVRGF